MRVLRNIVLIFLHFIVSDARAQERFFEYMPGSRSNFSTELEDGYLFLGLDVGEDGPLDHYYLIGQIDFQGELIDEIAYEVDTVDVTTAFKTSQRGVRIGEMIYMVGHFGNPSDNNRFYGGLFRHDIAVGETELVASYDDDEFVRIDCIAQKNDTSLLTGGAYANNFNLNTLILREIDPEGNIQWSFEESCNGNCRWFAHTILPLSNGHSALLVNAINANFPTFEDREKSILIVVDENGEEVWRVEPGNPDDYKTLPGGLLEIDGTILLCYTDPYYYDESGEWQFHLESTVHLVSYDLDGELISETDLSGLIPDFSDPENPDAVHVITQLIQLDESNILFSGHTSNEGLLISYDLEGELNWIRHHHPHPLDYPNALQGTEIYHTLQTSDGGFLCTGQYFTFPFELEPDGQQTAFALKVDQYGCLEEGCQGSLNTVVATSDKRLKLWPNPAQDQLYVELPSAEQAQSIQFIDGTGRTALTLANRPVSENLLELDLSPLPAGFYLLRLTTQSGEVYSGKVVVE